MTNAHQAPVPPTFDDEIDFRELFHTLWTGKWLIAVITFAGAVVGVVIALMLPDIYRSEALLAPNQDEGAGELRSRP